LCLNWVTKNTDMLSSPKLGGSHFCTYFRIISHDQAGFERTHYGVLRSSLPLKLPLWGYQCSLCMHPCLHAIEICLYPVPQYGQWNRNILNLITGVLMDQPAIKDLMVRLSQRGVSYTILNISRSINISQFISSLKVGAFLLMYL